MSDREEHHHEIELNEVEDILDHLVNSPGDIYSIGIEAEGEIELKKRPRGILSHTDREYLFGLRDYEHPQSESNRKQKIRERVKNAFKDFSHLSAFLGSNEQQKVFRELEENTELELYLEEMISFLYLGICQDKDRFEKIIENGVYSAANKNQEDRWSGPATNVETSIQIDYQPDVDGPYQKLEEGKGQELTPAEIGVLVRAGKLDPKDLGELEDSEPRINVFHVNTDSEGEESEE